MSRFLKVQEWIDRILEHSYEFYSVCDEATAKMAKAYNMRLRQQTSQKINQWNNHNKQIYLVNSMY